MMDSTKNISTREGEPAQDQQDNHSSFVQAEKARYAAEARDSGNQHKTPLVVTVGGQTIYTRDNF